MKKVYHKLLKLLFPLYILFISGLSSAIYADTTAVSKVLPAVNSAVGARINDGTLEGAVINNREDGTLKFAVVSDVHITIGSPSVFGARACVRDINKNKEIQFVLITGDIANFGRDDELAKAKEIFDELQVPWFIIAGNHDATWSESGTNSFLKTFGYERFDFTAGGIRFLGTQCGPNLRMAPALVPKESMLWLREKVEEMSSEQPFIFVNHYPLDTSLLKYDEVLSLLKQRDIRFVFSGHWHVDKPIEYEGIPAAVIRSILATGDGDIGYVVAEIKDNEITLRDKIVDEDEREIWRRVKLSGGKSYREDIVYEHPLNTFNEEYPFVKEVWRYDVPADVGSAAALYKSNGKYTDPIKGANMLPTSRTIEKGDLIIFSDEAGMVRALDATDGSEVWSYRCGGKIFSSPAVSGKIVIIGCSDNYIYALSATTGKLLWRYECKKSVLGSANIMGGVAYIGASDGSLRAINVKTGKLKWEYGGMRGFVVARPYVDDKQVVIGDWANRLYSLDPKSGRLQWIWRTPKSSAVYSPAQVWPVKSDEYLFIVTPDRVSYIIDAATGRQFARNYGGREAIGLSPDGSAYYIKSMKDTVRAYSTTEYDGENINSVTDSKVLWQTITDYNYEIAPSPITVAPGAGENGSGILFIPTDKGNIYALDCADGSVLWKHHLSGALINYILPVGCDKLIVSAMDGVVALLEY